METTSWSLRDQAVFPGKAACQQVAQNRVIVVQGDASDGSPAAAPQGHGRLAEGDRPPCRGALLPESTRVGWLGGSIAPPTPYVCSLGAYDQTTSAQQLRSLRRGFPCLVSDAFRQKVIPLGVARLRVHSGWYSQ